MTQRPAAVAFDIIGTVFDLEPLRQPLRDLGLPEAGLDLLYARTVRDACALAATDSYAPFRAILEAVLDSLLAEYKASPSRKCIQGALDAMNCLPPHPGAGEAFALLKDTGIRVMALSNGAAAFTKGLLDHSGLAGHVEHIVSVDDIRCLKPAGPIYRYAAEVAGLAPGALALVATHPWDIHGASAAGLMTGYVARGRPYPPMMRSPDVAGETLTEVAAALAALPAS